MRRIMIRFLILFLIIASVSVYALASVSPAATLLGSDTAAAHLATHIGASNHGWLGSGEPEPMDQCANGHLHCCGRHVSVWDTPQKGNKTGHLYPGSKVAELGPGSEFQLIKILHYKNGYFANIRIFRNGFIQMTGWVNTDYLECSCQDYTETAEIEEYEEISLRFDLR